MGTAISLREDYDGGALRRLAKAAKDANRTRRLLALAVVYDGGKRSDAAEVGGVTLQIVRDWILRFNAEGPCGLIDRKAPGARPKLDAAQRRALAERVDLGPIPAVDGVVRWRLKDLAQWVFEEYAITLDEDPLGRYLKAMDFRKIWARPQAAFKKNFPAELAAVRARLPAGTAIELWWQDEARIGQKTKITRRWARRGTRPRAQGPEHQVGLHLRSHLSGAWLRSSPRPAQVRHPSHAMAPGGNLDPGQPRRPWRGHSRSGGMARLWQARDPFQHLAPISAAKGPGAEPGGKRRTTERKQRAARTDGAA